MKKIVLILAFAISVFANEIVIKESSYSVEKTVKNIKNILNKKGVSIFAIVDHKVNAQKVSMDMNDAKVIIFGNPKMGTKFMQNNILSALDLPLKILVYTDEDSKVKVAYRDGTWLKNEHGLTNDKLTSKLSIILNKITDKATK
jgi:uncharacterized protein (DUF302 family)